MIVVRGAGGLCADANVQGLYQLLTEKGTQ